MTENLLTYSLLTMATIRLITRESNVMLAVGTPI